MTEAEKQLTKLVAMPTISDDTVANDLALDHIENYLAKRGMLTRRDRFNGHGTLLAATPSATMLAPKVLLTAHVDVMEGSKRVFTLQAEGDKLLGRGVYDMKFSIAGYMEVIDQLQDKLDEYDLGVMITTDEEYGGKDDINGAHRLVELGLRPQVCIMPDSTAPNWDIEIVAKGYWRFDLIAKGKAAHGSRPWQGDSASVKLINALHELKERFKDQRVETDSLNIGVIQGGVTYNQVPDHMLASIEIRYTSQQRLDALRKIIARLCKKHGLTIQERALGPLVLTDLSHPLVSPYLDSVEKITGPRPQPFTSCAATDAPYFFAEGINCIISCCEGGLHHSEDEWISRKSFLQFVPILRDYLDRVAKR
ncbi:MAG: M20 family metallopeptidase [Candidatus Saccharimonadales bacterium]